MCSLDWTAPVPASLLGPPFDVILGSDCVFWPSLFAPLLTTLRALVDATPAGSEAPLVLLTVTSRLDRAERFSATAEACGWRLEEVPVLSPMDGGTELLAACGPNFPRTKLVRLRPQFRA